jgi:ATP-dependent RNA helicase RhlE
MSKFSELNLNETIVKAVQAEGYTQPTPIQTQAIPKILARHDLLACAQTGTGKTAAFALPILQILDEQNQKTMHRGPNREIRVLILTPTRELASQIGESFTNYGRGLNVRNTVIFGGVGQNTQVRALRAGVDVVIATPGRLLDLLQQKLVRLTGLEIFVLDEADRMLDMGFIHDVKRVIAVIPKKRQTLFFSATMPPEISRLAGAILTQPHRVEVNPVASTAEKIDQAVYQVQENLKLPLLKLLLEDQNVSRSLVFTRTKRDANRVAESLQASGIGAAAIHGNKSQGARERALAGIKKGTTRVLVATDIAARGIDIDGITHVFNYDIPNVPESYVHRIGRTARAGAAGIAISFCNLQDERGFFSDIERLIRKRVNVLRTPDGLVPEARGKKGNSQPEGFGPPGGGGGRRQQRRPERSHGRPQGGPSRDSNRAPIPLKVHAAPAAKAHVKLQAHAPAAGARPGIVIRSHPHPAPSPRVHNIPQKRR